METEARTPSVTPSAREGHVLELIAKGYIDREIATEMGISLPTVRVYRQRLLYKLGTKGAIQTVLVAWRRGFLDLDALADEAVETADARLGKGRR